MASMDDKQYERAKNAWMNLCIHCFEKCSTSDRWQELEAQFADGTPIQNGNPICSYINRAERKALRIIQSRDWPQPIRNDLIVYIDKTQTAETARKPIYELVISGKITPKNVNKSKILIALWISRATTLKKMQTFIRKHLKPASP